MTRGTYVPALWRSTHACCCSTDSRVVLRFEVLSTSTYTTPISEPARPLTTAILHLATMVSAGVLIYSGFMPLIKTYALSLLDCNVLLTFVSSFAALICGYVLVKMDMFPPAASRGLSIISMNIALPALIFANIVPSFTPQNISALGPVILIASIYMFSGFIMGIIIREVCYVPRNFWQGIVIMTGMSNWGNLREYRLHHSLTF